MKTTQTITRVTNPVTWTAITWVAVLAWLWGPISLNCGLSVSYEVNWAENLPEPTHYKSMAEYPFPVGWPFHYVEPDDPWKTAGPQLATALPPVPGPSSVSRPTFCLNLILIFGATTALVMLSQRLLPRFSLSVLLCLPLAYGFYFFGARLTGFLAGLTAIQWYSNAIYFLPIPLYLSIEFFGVPCAFPAKEKAG
jgi:hypothetical protein